MNFKGISPKNFIKKINDNETAWRFDDFMSLLKKEIAQVFQVPPVYFGETI